MIFCCTEIIVYLDFGLALQKLILHMTHRLDSTTYSHSTLDPLCRCIADWVTSIRNCSSSSSSRRSIQETDSLTIVWSYPVSLIIAGQVSCAAKALITLICVCVGLCRSVEGVQEWSVDVCADVRVDLYVLITVYKHDKLIYYMHYMYNASTYNAYNCVDYYSLI